MPTQIFSMPLFFSYLCKWKQKKIPPTYTYENNFDNDFFSLQHKWKQHNSTQMKILKMKMNFFFDNVKIFFSLCYTNEKNTFYENESN